MEYVILMAKAILKPGDTRVLDCLTRMLISLPLIVLPTLSLAAKELPPDDSPGLAEKKKEMVLIEPGMAINGVSPGMPIKSLQAKGLTPDPRRAGSFYIKDEPGLFSLVVKVDGDRAVSVGVELSQFDHVYVKRAGRGSVKATNLAGLSEALSCHQVKSTSGGRVYNCKRGMKIYTSLLSNLVVVQLESK